MRLLIGMFAVGAAVCIGGPATAAIAVKSDATPERLGQCAIALNEWKAISEAQNRTPEPFIVTRLQTIMATPYGRDPSPSSRMANAMVIQIAHYDALQAESGQTLINQLQADILGCDAVFDTDQPLVWPTEAAETSPKGPFLVGQRFQLSPTMSPSDAGYCFLAFDSLRRYGESQGTPLDQDSRDKLKGFTALIDGNTRLYRQAALSSAENRGVFYKTYGDSHDAPAFLALMQADAADCAKWLLPR